MWPITTGGVGSKEDNLVIFEGVVKGLIKEGRVNLFNQLPYEACLAKLAKKWVENQTNPGYCWSVMDEFYAPIFETKLICVGFFIPGWESSTGARFERKKIVECEGEVKDLTIDEVENLLRYTLADLEVTRLVGLMNGALPPQSVS